MSIHTWISGAAAASDVTPPSVGFLAAQPYHAYTPRQIVQALTRARQPVTEATLDRHIASLREKRGFFADYIRTAPYIGYRFKE